MASKSPFWSTLPGILTAVAALLTAVATLVAALFQAGLFGSGGGEASRDADAPDPALAATPPVGAAPESRAPRRLRTRPAELDSEAASAMLARENFFDSARNLGGSGARHAYRVQTIGDAAVVVDDALGLMWERGGAGPMPFAAAQARVDRLNAERSLGYADWRLPTAEEAMSLAEPVPARDGFSLDPVFDRAANYVWTCDRAPEGRAWLARYHGAELAAERVEFNAMVRAVRGAGD